VAAGATQKPHFSLPSGKLQSDRLLVEKRAVGNRRDRRKVAVRDAEGVIQGYVSKSPE
jgi:hypothetical protein